MKVTKLQAILSLVPGAEVGVRGAGDDEAIEWYNPAIAPVTNQQIESEYQRLLALPEPVNIPAISDRQFFQQAAVAGMISQDEALAAVATGTIPPSLAVIVDAMTDPAAQFAAKMLLSGATVFERQHPLTDAIGVALNMTSEQIDAFFVAAALL